MNTAASAGGALQMRNWMTASDEWLSPQAAVLSPDATIRIANAIVKADNPYHRALAAGRAAVNLLQEGRVDEKLHLSQKEQHWLTRIDRALNDLPQNWETLMEGLEAQYGGLYDKRSYGL
jgi:hypothetical protein